MSSDNRVETERYYYRFEELAGPRIDQKAEPEIESELKTIGDYASKALAEPRFWRRQFGAEVTQKQRKFDWTFGVFLPLVCFFFDPILFRSSFGDRAMLEAIQPFTYGISALSIMALAAWLLWGDRLGAKAAWLSGLFFAASLVSLLIGVAILPMSLLGLIVIIGLLGFTPLLTSIVFARNGLRAWRSAEPLFESRTLIHVIALSSLIALTVPMVINQQFHPLETIAEIRIFPWVN